MSAMQHWFAQPQVLWLLLILPAAAILSWLARRRRARSLSLFGSGLAFERIVQRRRGWHRRVRATLLALGLLLVVVGSAGPQWGQDWSQASDPGRDLIVVLDLSRSMLAEDPSRLEQSKEALIDLAAVVKSRGKHRLALVLFAPHASVACHLTYDADHFAEVVEGLDKDHLEKKLWPDDPTLPGSNLEQGIDSAVQLLDDRQPGKQDLLLLSDGGDQRLTRSVVKAVLEKGSRILCVGVGDPDNDHPIPIGETFLMHDGEQVRTRLREDILTEIASRTGGVYERLNNREQSLRKLFLRETAVDHRDGTPADALPVYRQRYVYFLLPALILLLGAVALGEGKR